MRRLRTENMIVGLIVALLVVGVIGYIGSAIVESAQQIGEWLIQAACVIGGLLFLALIAVIFSSVSSCTRYCSDIVSDLKPSNIGVVAANTRTSPLAAEYRITAVSESALQKKEEAIAVAMSNCHYHIMAQYQTESAARFSREVARRTSSQQAQEKLKEAVKRIQDYSREDKEVRMKLRDFALRESPVLWETIQTIKAEIEVRDRELSELKEAMCQRGAGASDCSEYKRICRLRNRLVRSLRKVEESLASAYTLKCQYDAMPTNTEFEKTARRAIEDGVREARMAEKRYKEMKRARGGPND